MARPGHLAEARAAQWLQQQGVRVITRNWRAKTGEIDLIGITQNILLFIEVRQRKSAHYGGAAASISYHKQSRLMRTAQLYLQAHPQHQHRCCRFDAVLLHGSETKGRWEWIQNAFSE